MTAFGFVAAAAARILDALAADTDCSLPSLVFVPELGVLRDDFVLLAGGMEEEDEAGCTAFRSPRGGIVMIALPFGEKEHLQAGRSGGKECCALGEGNLPCL